MRSSLIVIALIIVFASCTKSTTNEKTKPSSTLSTSVSSSVSSNIDQPVTADGLKQAAMSANTNTISSTAFNSVCPLSVDPSQNNPKCLYYRDQNNIYQLCFPLREKKLVFSFEKEKVPSDKIKEPFEVAAGHVMWKSGEDLYVWDGTKAFLIADSGFITSFLFSPNGQCLVWNANWRAGFPVIDEGRFSDSENKENSVFISKTGSQDRIEVYRQTYRVDHLGSDNREDKQLVAWSAIMPSTLYLTTKVERQLYSGHTGIYVVDFASGTETILNGEIEEFLAMSSDERKIAYTPNDKTCCGGSNYTNNTVIIWNAVSKKSASVYDEWKEFGNQGKEDEYVPDTAVFSPDGNLIAISIVGNKYFTTIRKVDGGGNILTVADRFAVGWLDQDTLILGKRSKADYRQRYKVQDMYIYKLKSGKEEPLSLNNVTYLAFK